jgi:hypothetical protein
MQGSHDEERRDFLTLLDNILTVGVSAGSEERYGRPHSQPGGRLERAGGGYEKWHNGRLHRGTAVVIRALQEVHEDRWRPYRGKQ